MKHSYEYLGQNLPLLYCYLYLPNIFHLAGGTALLFKVHHSLLDVLLWKDAQCLSS